MCVRVSISFFPSHDGYHIIPACFQSIVYTRVWVLWFVTSWRLTPFSAQLVNLKRFWEIDKCSFHYFSLCMLCVYVSVCMCDVCVCVCVCVCVWIYFSSWMTHGTRVTDMPTNLRFPVVQYFHNWGPHSNLGLPTMLQAAAYANHI